MEEIQKQWQINKIFEPIITEKERMELASEWKRAVRTTQHWAEE